MSAIITCPIPNSGNAMTEQQVNERKHYATLIQQVAQNQDTKAFEELFNHFGPLIKSFALSSGIQYQGDHYPDELVQEVMLSLWRKAHLFDPKKSAPSTWIFTIARNQRIDLLRKQNKHSHDISADDIWELESNTDLFSEIRDNRIRHHVSDAIKDLPNEQKQIISKVFLEDRSHQDVANEFAIPLGTVKSRVRLAMQKLKGKLGESEL